MATVCVTVGDAEAVRIAEAIAASQGRAFSTPEEGVAMVRAAVFGWLRDQTLLYEAQRAREAVLTNLDDPLVGAVTTQGEG